MYIVAVTISSLTMDFCLASNTTKKIFFYKFFLMYKYGCLYVYYRFIMLDKGMKSILKFCQLYMEVTILIASQYKVSRDV